MNLDSTSKLQVAPMTPEAMPSAVPTPIPRKEESSENVDGSDSPCILAQVQWKHVRSLVPSREPDLLFLAKEKADLLLDSDPELLDPRHHALKGFVESILTRPIDL